VLASLTIYIEAFEGKQVHVLPWTRIWELFSSFT